MVCGVRHGTNERCVDCDVYTGRLKYKKRLRKEPYRGYTLLCVIGAML